LDSGEPRPKLGVLALELVEVIARDDRAALALLREVPHGLAHPTLRAGVTLHLEACAQRDCRLRVAEVGERASHVEAQQRVGVVEELLQDLADLPILRELRERQDGRASRTR